MFKMTTKTGEPHLIRLRREIFKIFTFFTSHRTPFGRMMRTRGCKKLPKQDFLLETIERAVSIVDGFDPKTEVLFLGSSHIQKGIAPAVFKETIGWNAGVSSGDLKMSCEIYEGLRKKWPKADGQCVVLGEDFWLHSSQSEFSYEYFQTAIMHCLLGMSYRSTFLMRYAERVCQRLISMVRTSKSWEERVKLRGLMPMKTNLVRASKDAVQARVKMHSRFINFEPTEIKWLYRLKELVAIDGRTLVFLRTPHRDDYLAALDAHVKEEQLRAPLATARGTSPIIDFFRLQLPQEGWNDADHLSQEGAEYFSCLLEAELLALKRKK